MNPLELGGIFAVIAGAIGSTWYGVNTLFRKIWVIQQYLATITEATKYQTKKLDELATVDDDLTLNVENNTVRISDIERYLELDSKDKTHPFVIRGGARMRAARDKNS